MNGGHPWNGLLAAAAKAWSKAGMDGDSGRSVGSRFLPKRAIPISRNPARSVGVFSSCTRARFVAPVGLALVLAACAPASTPAASPATRTDADSASACPIDTFDAFLERFGREIAFQELTTADPLVVERYDTAAEPEPRRVVENVALADVVWPVMPRLELIGGSGRTYDIKPIADGRMEVQVRTPDTSDQQNYVFRRSPCWQLQRVVDESI